MPLVIHPHFHPRRTGVTRHVESVVPALGRHVETRVTGRSLSPELPSMSLLEVWRQARKRKVVWHAHRNNELLVGILLRLLGAQLLLVFTRHSSGRPGWYTRLLMRKADKNVALTPQLATLLPPGAAVVGHGLELERFRPPEDRKAAFRSLGLGGKYGLMFIGRVREDKGALDFTRAVAPLLKKYPEWHAVFVGKAEPSFRAQLKAVSEDLLFVDEVLDIERWYQAATVVVQPSWAESYALVRLEAMASACCLIASRLPQLPDNVEHGKTGFLFEPRDVEEFRILLDRVMSDPALAQSIGERSSLRAQQEFGVEREARELATIYMELLNSGDGHGAEAS